MAYKDPEVAVQMAGEKQREENKEGVKGTLAITDFDRAWQSAQEIIAQKLL